MFGKFGQLQKSPLSLVAALLVLQGCQGGERGAATEGLAPLPAPPVVQVEREGNAGELSIVAHRPSGASHSANPRPTLTFSKPIVSLEMLDEQEGPTFVELSPEVKGEWRWLGSTSVEFVSESGFPWSSEFTVKISAGVKALDGSLLKEGLTFTFQTARLEVESISPHNGTAWASPNQPIELITNYPVKSLLESVSFSDESGRAVPLELSKSENLWERARAENAKEGEQLSKATPEQLHANPRTRYVLKPKSALKLGETYTIAIAKTLRATEGELGPVESEERTFRVHPPMKIESARFCSMDDECPYGPLVIKTTSKADVSTLKKLFSIEPAVELYWDEAASYVPDYWYGETDEDASMPYLTLRGRYRPGTTYKISIAKGLKDEEGGIAEAYKTEAPTSHLRPRFDVGNSLALIESKGDGRLPVEYANIDALQVSLWRLTPQELVKRLTWERWSNKQEPLPSPEPTARVALPIKRNSDTTAKAPIELLPHLKSGERSGFFAIQVRAQGLKDDYANPARVVAQVTDLAVHSKMGPKEGLLYVTRLSTGQPEAEVELSILGPDGATRWSGKSDGSGLSAVPGMVALGFERRSDLEKALAYGQKGDEFGATLLGWNDGLEPYAFGIGGGWDGEAPISLGALFTDRGVYRPGDEVRIKGIVRERKVGVISRLAEGSRITFELNDSRGNDHSVESARVNAFGSFTASFTIPADAPLGSYYLNAKSERNGWSANFRVEEYRAPQFKVDVTAPQDRVRGEELKASTSGRYLFGAAMPGAKVNWAVVRTTDDYSPPGNEGFEFGQESWWWSEEGSHSSSTEHVASGEGLLGADGSFAFAVGKVEAPSNRSYLYTVEAEVTDVNRQRVANRSVTRVHPSSLYAGLKVASSGFAEANKAASVELIAVKPDGARQEGAALELKVARRDWKSIRKLSVGGEWETQTEQVDTEVAHCKEKSAALPVTCTFTPAEPGLYVLNAIATDSEGRTHESTRMLYVVGNGWVSWNRNDSDRIDLVADKAQYDVGQTAKIMVKSPYPEAEALLTVEREGVMTRKIVHLAGSAVTLDVPIKEDYLPNIYVGIVLTRGRVPEKAGVEGGDDPGRPAARYGYLRLNVERRSKRLAVKVTPDSEEKRPRDSVTVSVAVNDYTGKGKKSEVHVWAVDEAVLRLTGYEPPDLVSDVHVVRDLSVYVGEPLINLVRRADYSEKGETAGGSGGYDTSGVGIRSEFKTTVLFESLFTDADGKGKVTFKLPDNLTTFRIMAIAATREDLFGGGASEVRVSKPLLALPATPRFALVGDAFEAGVVIHAKSKELSNATVAAKVQGDEVELVGPAERSVALVEGKPIEVRFPFKGKRAGAAALQFVVKAGVESDGVEQKLPVKLPTSIEAVAAYGETDTKRVEGLVPPGGVHPDIGGLSISASSTALGNFDEAMRHLIEYPYGCVEQLSSRLIPLIALRELHGLFKIPWNPARKEQWSGYIDERSLSELGAKDPDALVRLTIKKIEALQLGDGGFGYWSSSWYPSIPGSAYAVLALARAKEVGYPVSESVLERGQSFLEEKVAAGRCIADYGGCETASDAARAFALYALARSGKPARSYYDALFEKRQTLPSFARAMLADALQLAGDKARAKSLALELANSAKESAGKLYIEESENERYSWLWSSNERTTAIVLATLVDVMPEHPHVAKMARWIAEARGQNGRYGSTQESAFSLMALTEVVRVKERQEPDFIAKVLLGDAELAAIPFKGRSMKVERKEISIAELAKQKEKVPMTFAVEGKGLLYYGALLRYAPLELQRTSLERGITVQRWFEPMEGGGQSLSFKAGELVRVVVRVATHMERHYVAIDVPLPAGLEPVDSTLSSTARLVPHTSGGESDGEGEGEESGEGRDPYEGWYYTPFNHTELRDDRVSIFSDTLPAGVYTKRFVARALMPGDYLLKPARAEEMYEPEVFGRSDGGSFKVTAGESEAK